MNTDGSLSGLTSRIIGSAQVVSNTLGCGFLEKVYENALALELRGRGLRVSQQHRLVVRYGGEVVGECFADLFIDEKVIVELKASTMPDALHEAQCINYLRASGAPICLLVNFARPRLHVRRFINT